MVIQAHHFFLSSLKIELESSVIKFYSITHYICMNNLQ